MLLLFHRNRLTASIAALFFLLPASASAASLYLETPPGAVSSGDTIVVSAYLDTDAAPANALDGAIALSLGDPAVFSIKTISLAGSELTLWPTSPAVSADGKSVVFTGGLPGGFTGKHLLLFSMVLAAEAPGTATFTPGKTTLYLNDGKGTATPVGAQAFLLAVQAAKAGAAPRDEWQSTVSGDTTPPEPFTISAGQDPSVYGGKKFIYFQTTDAQSGIDHYMVKEGDAAPVESGSTYVLQNQTNPVSITVYAYDKAGNVRTSVYNPGAGAPPPITLIVLAALILLAAALGIAYLVKRKTAL